MARIEDDAVPRRIEHPVDAQGQFDNPKVGTEMATGLGHVRDEELADFRSEAFQLPRAEFAEVLRITDCLQ
jgi:hypothetical protein